MADPLADPLAEPLRNREEVCVKQGSVETTWSAFDVCSWLCVDLFDETVISRQLPPGLSAAAAATVPEFLKSSGSENGQKSEDTASRSRSG